MQEGKVVAYGCPMKKKLQKRRIVREETQQIMNRDKDKDKVLKTEKRKGNSREFSKKTETGRTVKGKARRAVTRLTEESNSSVTSDEAHRVKK
ncbi:hypothetical protein ACE6H2_012117 [Prunus campanulata]